MARTLANLDGGCVEVETALAGRGGRAELEAAAAAEEDDEDVAEGADWM